MEEKTTLFTYVYGSIRQDIVQGVLPRGSKLPSLRQLSARYHVGMRTVRDVMAALRDDGYIETFERKRAVVRYGDDADPEQAAVVLLARRATVEQSLRTMEAIMPAAFAACADGRIGERQAVAAAVGKLPVRNSNELARSSLALHEILDVAGNATLSECYACLERAVALPQRPGRADPCFDALRAHRGIFAALLAGLAAGKGDDVEARMGEMLACVAVHVEAFFDELAAAHPQAPSPPSAFAWNAKAGHVYAHAAVTRDLVERVADGSYPLGAFLPSIDELARRYGVSSITVRKALGMMRDIGIVETINGRGTRVTSLTLHACGGPWHASAFRAGIEVFLDALELLVEILPPSIHVAFDALSRSAPDAPEKGEDWSLPRQLMASLIACQPLQPLQVILGELNGLLRWGFVFFLARPDGKVRAVLMDRARRAAQALADGDERAFAASFASYYRTMLVEITAYLVQAGFAIDRPRAHASKAPTGSGGAYANPSAASQPAACSDATCPLVSTPSATV